jgi:DNA-directed RNA polymerase subunit RPC12/RpoP
MRCLECGAEPAETVQVCVRCGAPAGLDQPVAAAPTAGPTQIRCLECGAEPAETARVCVRCGAPVGLDQPVATAPAAGGPGSAIAPLAAGAPAGPRGQRTRRYSRRKGLVVTGVGVVILAAPITVIGVMDSYAPSANQSASSTNQPTSDQLRPGDCLAGSNMDLGTSTPWPEHVTRVPCTKRHEAEVFFAANVWPQSQAFPGKAAIDSQADTRCGKAFTVYDGIDVSQSAFTYDEIVLDSSDWASGERSLACVAYEPSPSGPSGAAPVNYSIKGSKK